MTYVDTLATLAAASHDGPVWSHAGDQLTINLLRFQAGDGIPLHRNTEVEVLLVIVAGQGHVQINQTEYPVAAGAVVTIPVGVERAVRASSADFAYITCHQRRAGLQPSVAPSGGSGPL